jgi:hypothetical protein
MSLPLEALIWAVILGGWTYIWLVWSFQADIRAWLAAALFPRDWLAGVPRRNVAIMSPSSLDKWLVSSSAPLAVCQLLTCYKCYSAHVAGYGTLILAFAGVLPILVLPLVWAFGAAVGNILYDHTYKRTH